MSETMNEATARLEAGRLLCRPIREYLEGEIFKGVNIRYRESSGWVTRLFTIIGDEKDVRRIYAAIQQWAE